MTGHSIINEVLWTDAEIEFFKIDYDSFDIKIIETSGRKVLVSAKGFIGYKVVGFWDEIVIERGVIHDEHDFQNECLSNLKSRLGDKIQPTGCDDRKLDNLKSLEIKLIDGCSIIVVATKFVLDIDIM